MMRTLTNRFAKRFAASALLSIFTVSTSYAADTVNAAAASPVLGVFKTLMGLLVVLAVMAAVAWLAKRVAGKSASSHYVARIVGGVSVGSRERVVVIEVGKRWLVVGVAAGSVNAIANLSPEDVITATAADDIDGASEMASADVPQAFAAKLKQSLSKAIKSQ